MTSGARFYCKIETAIGEPPTLIELEADTPVEALKRAVMIEPYHDGYLTFELYDGDRLLYLSKRRFGVTT